MLISSLMIFWCEKSKFHLWLSRMRIQWRCTFIITYFLYINYNIRTCFNYTKIRNLFIRFNKKSFIIPVANILEKSLWIQRIKYRVLQYSLEKISFANGDGTTRIPLQTHCWETGSSEIAATFSFIASI